MSNYSVILFWQGHFAFIGCKTLQLAEALHCFLSQHPSMSQVHIRISNFTFGL